jgi:hypothetical protein
MIIGPIQIVDKRKELEEKIKAAQTMERMAKYDREKVEWELKHLQLGCRHLNIVEIAVPWQGGGFYFRRVSCPDCGKSGSRYDQALTNERNREWYKNPNYEAPVRCGLYFGEYDW